MIVEHAYTCAQRVCMLGAPVCMRFSNKEHVPASCTREESVFRLLCRVPLPAVVAMLCSSAWNQGAKERKAFQIPPLIYAAPIPLLLSLDRAQVDASSHTATCTWPDSLPLDQPVTMKTE